MTNVPFEQLQAELSKILEQVAAGEELVITRNGRPVARLVPEGRNGSHRNGNGTSLQGKAFDPNKFAGTLKLREDPNEFQRRMRDEWP